MNIRAITQNEWKTVRDLRLAAIEDSAASFAETLADVTSKSNDYWIEFTSALVKPHIMLVAEKGDKILGSVYGINSEPETGNGRIGGMWVSSEYRSRGIGKSLLDAVVEWGRDQGLHRIGLWAPTNIPPAKSMYLNAGFVNNGRYKVVGANGLEVEEMTLTLARRT